MAEFAELLKSLPGLADMLGGLVPDELVHAVQDGNSKTAEEILKSIITDQITNTEDVDDETTQPKSAKEGALEEARRARDSIITHAAPYKQHACTMMGCGN